MDARSDPKLSRLAETLIGSEILKLAWEVNDKIKRGERIHNLTIGDFDPRLFPIPAELKQEIVAAYADDATNYPPAEGLMELRQAVSRFLRRKGGLDYAPADVIIAAGARPLIYATYRTLVDEGDVVLSPVPSWNNNHYCHLVAARLVPIETTPANDFMPTASDLSPHVAGATLLALCSPLNPTGTVFTREALADICDLVLEENRRRRGGAKALYVMYDQIYWGLTSGDTVHHDPVSLRPEMARYTVFVDGISKLFAATGVRVGWTFGPTKIMDRMKSILGHMGAWAPKAEQVATAKYLARDDRVDAYVADIRSKVSARLTAFHAGVQALKREGFAVDSIAPQAALYLTVKVDLRGARTSAGQTLGNAEDVTKYLLDEARTALVPFHAFGASRESSWYRLSVGTCRLEQVDEVVSALRAALRKLS